MEFKENSSNLRQYLCGTEPRRWARWNEIIFLLELCHDSLSPSASDADQSVPSRKSHLIDPTYIREIESLLGSLLIDELFLDTPGTFEHIYAFRPLSQEIKPSSSNFRIETFQELSSILGRVSKETEYLNSSIQRRKESFTNDNGLGLSRNFLSLASDRYLLYLALGEPADLKQTIEYIRQQKFREWSSLDSSQIPSDEENTRQGSRPGHTTHPISKDLFSFCGCIM